jgi:hypothetical protein
MGTTTMTNVEEITIFDEIVNCGILEDDTIVNFGAGHKRGQFLQTLLDYNGTLGEGLITAVEPDKSSMKDLSKKFKGERVSYLEMSLQDYIDSRPENKDWFVITGVFDNYSYGDQQYEFIDLITTLSMEFVNKGVIFTLKRNSEDSFKNYILYFFMDFSTIYDRFTVKKYGDDNYVFCIFKQ